jgi:hypothetical protein
MATLLFKFVFLSNASPAVVLTSTELTGATAPTVNISSVALADGTTIGSVVASDALVYDSYTKSWSYRLAAADLATYVYTAMATTTYATASPASVHALGIVVPDELVSTRTKPADTQAAVTAVASVTGDVAGKVLGGGVSTITGVGANASALTAQETRDAMKLAPTSGAPTAGSVDAHLDAIPTTISPTVAISATAAAAVASGTIAIETHSTFSQAITSTSTAALNTATKLWLAIKADKDDADSAGLVLLEATGGLTVLAQATYATVANGTLVLSGSSGAWVVTAGLASTATGLLAAYVDGSYHAAIKYKIASGEFVLWTGMCEVSRGVVQAVA